MGRVRKQTYIDEDQVRLIKRLAASQGLSEAEILRRAVDAYLAGKGLYTQQNPLLTTIGMADSGGAEGSTRHDAIYVDRV